MREVNTKRLVHSGIKRAYPSSFVWDCLDCCKWNIWRTRSMFGKPDVTCQWCLSKFKLNKENPAEVHESRKGLKSIID